MNTEEKYGIKNKENLQERPVDLSTEERDKELVNRVSRERETRKELYTIEVYVLVRNRQPYIIGPFEPEEA